MKADKVRRRLAHGESPPLDVGGTRVLPGLTRRRMGRIAVLTLAVSTFAAAGCDPAPCPPPYHSHAGTTQAGWLEWPVPGTDWRTRPGAQPLDTDDDGIVDSASSSANSLTIVRSSGSLTLTAPAAAEITAATADGPSAGDVDGDGRTDIVVRVDAGSGPAYYVVPGASPDGSHELTAIGVQLGGATAESVLMAPGDVDNDGLDDLVLTKPATGATPDDTLLHRGSTLASAAPGSVAAPLSLGGRFIDLLALDETKTMVAVGTADADSFLVSLWFAGTATELDTGSGIVLPSYTGWPTARIGVAPDGRVWLVVEAFGPPFDGAWAWRLEDLCGVNG